MIAYLEATADGIGKTWPVWKRQHADAPQQIRAIVDLIAQQLPGKPGHHPHGPQRRRFDELGYLDSADTIDDRIARIAFLDSNYSYHDEDHHGDKLLAWLKGDPKRQLVVIAYDDRNIQLDGKPVVSATGGTWRASHRMIDRIQKDVALNAGTFSDTFDTFSGMNGQIHFFLHRNPTNEILHTRLVGMMSGFLEAATIQTPLEHQWGEFAGPVAYEKWISADPIVFGPGSRKRRRLRRLKRLLGSSIASEDALNGRRVHRARCDDDQGRSRASCL